MNNTAFAVDCKTEITVSRTVPHMVSLKEADYVEKSAEGYEKYMQREYGEEWRNVNFEYS